MLDSLMSMINRKLRFSIYPVVLIVALVVQLGACQHSMKPSEGKVSGVFFEWFEYTGKDKLFDQKLAPGEFQNPVLPGFYPDPSIVRVDDDYYMVNSSFGYFPGLPVFKSTDLVSWQQIGHALTKESQFNFSGLRISKGIFAPTLRYHEGTYYLVTTAVDSGGNFLITSSDPAGPWSDPVFLPEVGGIDPDIFFDDDGRVYITHNSTPIGEPLYDGHRAIWIWEFDLSSKKIIPGSDRLIVDGGVDITKEPIWIEGPHIYKTKGWYYLMCAEGGTGDQHSVVIFRSKSLEEPFVPYEHNPILTQRDLDPSRPNPIANAITTPDGKPIYCR